MLLEPASCFLEYTQALEWLVELEDFEAIGHVWLWLNLELESANIVEHPLAKWRWQT